MDQLRRLAKLVAIALGGLVYVWFAAVKNTDRVRARKAARRRERLARRGADTR